MGPGVFGNLHAQHRLRHPTAVTRKQENPEFARAGLALPCEESPDSTRSTMPSVFHTNTPLAASAEVMFGFHSDPSNLTQVMPPTLTLVSLKTDGPAQEGRMIELHCRDWWILPMRWNCRWKTVRPPQFLVDEMVKGPFTIFIHEHRFEAQGADRCVMHDTITYQWGQFLVGETIITATAVEDLSGASFQIPPPPHPEMGAGRLIPALIAAGIRPRAHS